MVIKWVDLQAFIQGYFSISKVQTFKSVFEKAESGTLNWILSFHSLTFPSSTIIHTKFIFNLTSDKQELTKNEFLYLYDYNCKFRKVSFDNQKNLKAKLDDIFEKNKFANDVTTLSNFMVSPAISINQFFYDKKIQDLTVFDFTYEVSEPIMPCQDLYFRFKMNINNIHDIILSIRKEDKFKLTFQWKDRFDTIVLEDINSLIGAIANYLKENVG